MSKAEVVKEALRLKKEDRVELVSILESSLDSPPLYEWQKQAIDEALATLAADPDAGAPAEQVEAELREELETLRSA